jgi:hypothetical protein
MLSQARWLMIWNVCGESYRGVAFACNDWENLRNILASLAFSPAGIQTEHLLNTNVQLGRYSSLLVQAHGTQRRTREDDLIKSSCDLSQNWISLLRSAHETRCLKARALPLFICLASEKSAVSWSVPCTAMPSLPRSRRSSVGGLDGPGLIPGRFKIVVHHSVQTDSAAHTASYPMCTVGSSPEIKRPGRRVE